MIAKPKVTIITPTYNAEKDIEVCILSVANQTYANKEHLIIDGASSDDTLAILKKYSTEYRHLHFISEKDDGIYHAMNKGIDMAAGHWIYFMGSDDTFFEDSILEDIFNGQELDDYDVVYGDVQWGYSQRVYDGKFSQLKLIDRNICHQALFFKASVFQTLGKFDLKYKYLADYAFNMKWFNNDAIRFKYLNKTIAHYSINGVSSTISDEIFWEDRKSIIKEHFPDEYVVWMDKLNNLELRVEHQEQDIQQKRLEIQQKENDIRQKDHNIQQKEQEIRQKKQEIRQKVQEIQEKEQKVCQRDQQLLDCCERVDQLEARLKAINNSLSWRLTAPLRSVGLLAQQVFKKVGLLPSIMHKDHE